MRGLEEAVVAKEVYCTLIVLLLIGGIIGTLIFVKSIYRETGLSLKEKILEAAYLTYTSEKVCLNLFIMMWVFNRNFYTKEWTFVWPEKLYLSTFLVGILGFTGFVDGIIEIRGRLKEPKQRKKPS